MKDFETFKQEILRRAKKANACVPEYKKAYTAIDFASLIEIIKNNFYWACSKGVIDSNIIKDYEEEFNAEKVYCNVDTSEGYLLASGSATVRAYDRATVEAYDRATVEAYDRATVEASCSATVRAYGRATVEASGSATVEAYDSATVEAYDRAYIQSYLQIECQIKDNAIYRVVSTNEIFLPKENKIAIKEI